MASRTLTASSTALVSLCGALLSAVGLALTWLRSFGGQRGAENVAVATPSHCGAYRLAAKLGEGGMGVVYGAEHVGLGRRCAVKLLTAHDEPGARERFEREISATRALAHRNIVEVFDAGTAADGSPYYVMELVDGQDLQSLVDREGPLSPARVVHVLAELASALEAAHAAGLVHRDVKPSNVMLSAGDRVKLVDFGLVKLQSDDGANAREARHIVGTPLYLSPEAIVSPETQDARSDLYALGALGYFLLTGAAPFSAGSLVEICSHHLHTPVAPPSLRSVATIPIELEQLILACLEKSPENRPSSARAIADALSAVGAPSLTCLAA